MIFSDQSDTVMGKRENQESSGCSCCQRDQEFQNDKGVLSDDDKVVFTDDDHTYRGRKRKYSTVDRRLVVGGRVQRRWLSYGLSPTDSMPTRGLVWFV